MPFGLETIASERQNELEESIPRLRKEQGDFFALQAVLARLDAIRDEMADSVVDKVTVTNLDEVKAALRNELNRVAKPLLSVMESMEMDKGKLAELKKKIQAENVIALEHTHEVRVTRKPKDTVTVSNLSDLVFPTAFRINNLKELEDFFAKFSQDIEKFTNKELVLPEIKIPTPQVNVSPPRVDVDVPETVVNVPEVDLSSLLEALKPLRFISDSPKKPISVRVASKDGKKFLNLLEEIKDTGNKQAVAFSQGLNEAAAKRAFKSVTQGTIGGSSSLELTDAASAVQITATSTACKYVDISANAGLANIGGSGSVATSGSEVGVTIYPGNLPYRVNTDNLNKVYAAGATGTRISWTYYV